ncbi:glycosyltransferase [Rhodococcus opacus]|uniref:glycosyltransferase n=1 Tax=Rhodococcus opacus TaxID=37919 RepID=UPI0022367419|nr:glycosyltransferase family 4 protein [Rhodococcus opacus]UZG57428.1 glycosyltransferase family 4 protein [Rhodococcus opacus]
MKTSEDFLSFFSIGAIVKNTSHAAGKVRPREPGGPDRRLRVAVVTAESTWPIRTGGHARVAGILTALKSHCELVIFGPKADTPPDIEHVEVRVPFDRTVGNYLSLGPRLGRSAFKRNERRRIAGLLAQNSFDVVIYTHSYLAAVIPAPVGTPSIVDFPNIEIDRQKSIASTRRSATAVLPWIESWKARIWEPRVVRRAHANIAVSDADADRIAQWNATTLLIPNATHVPPNYVRSPEDGYVIYACNGDYPPNKDAGDWLINSVWPHVISELPHARLVIVGRNTDKAFSYAPHRTGVRVVGTVDTLTPWLHDSAVAVAPVTAGGGSQLKILEFLAHRRCVVATEYSYRSVPEIFADGVERTNDAVHYARSIVGLLSDVDRRHKCESEIDAHAATLDWEYATRTLMQDVARVASLRGSAEPREVERSPR